MKIYEVTRKVEEIWNWSVVVFAENEEDALQVAINNGKKKLKELDYTYREYEEYDSFEVADVYIKEIEVVDGVILQYDDIR